MSAPNVSLVFETENEQEHRSIRLADNVDAWRSQTAASRILEWIIVAQRPARPEEERLLAGLPYRWIVRPGSAYYEQKNAGIAETQGSLISLCDSDDRPELDWLERAIASLESAPPDVAIVTGRTRYAPGPFSKEMTIAHFPFQQDFSYDVLTVGAGNSLFRANLLRQYLFQGDHIRHGPDVDLAYRLRDAGYRVVYEPALRMTHNYTDRASELWGHVAMKGHAFALYAGFRGSRRRPPLLDGIGRYIVLLRRLVRLRRPMEISWLRLPLSIVFYLWYVAAASYGYREALRGKPVPAFRF